MNSPTFFRSLICIPTCVGLAYGLAWLNGSDQIGTDAAMITAGICGLALGHLNGFWDTVL